MTSIGGICLAVLGTHRLFLHAKLDPEREEDENENDEPAHLGDGNRHAKETGQNAGVDGVTDHGIRAGDVGSLTTSVYISGLKATHRRQHSGCLVEIPSLS